MSLKHALSLGLALSTVALLVACGGEGSGSAPASGAASGKPTATAAMTATMTATAAVTAAPTATATASATASAAPAAVVGIAAGEMVAASCDTIAKDSECGEVVVTKEADKAKNMDVMKKLCKDGKVSENACSADKIVGTCRVMKDIINHYSSEGGKKYTADTAKKACEKAHGKWVSP